MRAIDRKLVRDLWEMKGQALAISLVIACGVATFVLSLSTLHSLEITQQTYYDRYRFADIFAHLKRAPDALVERIAAIPGVAQVQTRIVVSVNLDVPGLDEPAIGRILSLPETHPPVLNRLFLRRGQMLRPRRDDQILASEAFTEANGLDVGDTIRAVINGRRKKLRIVGIALSPEYIYEIREGEVLPDNQHFGVFWMNEEALSIAFDLDGAFNDIALGLMHGANADEVIHRLDDLIEPYGGLGSYKREHQTSNLFITNEIEELEGMGLIAPTIFLAVAAFLLNVVLSRMIGTQREQIAALKAFGYSRIEVGWHYMKLVLLIATMGVTLGSLVGAWFGNSLTQMYTIYFRFPVLAYQLGWKVLPLAWAISGVAAVLGILGAVLRAVRLPPAEAMRPEPPAKYRATFLERLGVGRLISPVARMVLRQLERRPLKAALSCLAIASAVAVLVLGNYMEDAIDYMMELDFNRMLRYDMMITTVEPVGDRAIREIVHMPGVLRAEPIYGVAARLRGGHHHRQAGILGIDPEGELFQFIDMDGTLHQLPPDGLVLSAKMAEILGAAIGDDLTIEVLERDRPVCRVPLVGTVDDFIGTNAYMSIDAVRRLMREGPYISGAYLLVDPRYEQRLYNDLKEIPKIANVAIKTAALKGFEETFAKTMLQIKMINVIFAVIIAIGVVYNTARISLAERSRELATLRVIGFTRGEISAILLGELYIITALAIPIGMIIGYWFAAVVSTSYDQELFRMPLIISRATYAFAATVVIAATVGSSWLVRRRLGQLDLVAVLKSKE